MSNISKVHFRFFEHVFEVNSEKIGCGLAFNSNVVEDFNGTADFRIEILPGGTTDLPVEGVSKFPINGGFIAYKDVFVILGTKFGKFVIETVGNRFRIFFPTNFDRPNLPQIPLEVSFLTGLRTKGLIPLHASAGSLNKNILFLGKTGAGKSTLVYLIDKSGGKVMADDRVFIFERGGNISACSAGRKIYLRDDKYSNPADKSMFLPQSNWSVSDTFEPEVLVFPEFIHTGKSELITIHPAETVLKLFPLTLPPKTKEEIEPLYNLVKKCKAYRLQMQKDKEKIPEIETLLNNIE